MAHETLRVASRPEIDEARDAVFDMQSAHRRREVARCRDVGRKLRTHVIVDGDGASPQCGERGPLSWPQAASSKGRQQDLGEWHLLARV